jgi:NAD(P)-dependent dehydrogenase (short-subunit alcohol dehydrogenase family)
MELEGKVCVVTGATSGIGQVTARVLAERGAEVVVVARNQAKCADTVTRIRQQSGNEKVEYLVADLSARGQIRELVKHFREHYDRLNVLVNNAGGVFLTRRESADGIEMTWALNHLGYFLLTNLLLDVLISSGAPGDASRIVNVASASHRGGHINFDDLQKKGRYRGMQAYGQSKLGNVLFTYELARRLERAGYSERVTANCLHPGFVDTNLAGDNGWLIRLFLPLLRFFGRTPEEGAQTSIYLAASPEVEGVTGKYFVDCKPVPSDPASYDQTVAERLWKISAEMTGLKRDAERVV